MHFYGTLHLLVTRWQQPGQPASDETLPEIAPGAFAAWASAEPSHESLRLANGDVRLAPDGRTGEVVEILDGGYPVRVGQAV